jgi:dCTP deaminase
MTFWSGEKLAERLGKDGLVTPFAAGQIDCAAYQLRLGSQAYVSPASEAEDPNSASIRNLWDHNGAITVPPGQFAFLITEEGIKVPADAIAFISIRARMKFRGLVNVSGFHVDPGYSGRLIFSVFNAGPAPVHLQRGEPYFLIWYADLDRTSARVKSESVGFKGIPTDLINPIAGEIQSFAGLLKKMKDSEEKLEKRLQKVENEHQIIRTVGTVLLTLAVALFLRAYLPSSESPHSPDRGSVEKTAPAAPSGSDQKRGPAK